MKRWVHFIVVAEYLSCEPVCIFLVTRAQEPCEIVAAAAAAAAVPAAADEDATAATTAIVVDDAAAIEQTGVPLI